MTSTKLEYYDIARIQIDAAIELYNSGNFICAITLAGAGEEILGKLLPPNAETAMRRLTKKVAPHFPELSEKKLTDNHLNLIKNGFKHLIEEICEQDIPIKLQAIQLIARASSNYAALTKAMTQAMVKFSEAHPPSSFDDATETA
jgi:hypothetical protein